MLCHLICWVPKPWIAAETDETDYFEKDKVVCWYLTSTFLCHTYAEDHEKKNEKGTQDLGIKKMIQISMDGANVKWKLYDNIV